MVKVYFDFDNGTYYKEEEIKASYENCMSDLPDSNYEEYLDRMLTLGQAMEGGLIEIEESDEAQEIVKTGGYDSAVELMDGELREKIHEDLAPYTDEEFLTAYMYAHEQKFDEAFTI